MKHMIAQKNPTSIPGYTWMGLLLMLAAQLGLVFEVDWIAIWLTPIMWSGYILFVDGLLYKKRGMSWLTNRKLEFPLLILLSIGIWLVFEVYNFHLQNWLYRGVPENPWVRNLAYAWSFATILPGVFVTSEFILSFLPTVISPTLFKRFAHLPDWTWIIVGVALVLIPLSLPVPIARFLFGAVWIGFIFLVDPVNQKLGVVSLKDHWTRGKFDLTLALLCGGLVCGLLWEAWNYQAYRLAGGHWIYTVPGPLRIFDLHYGQMPILGMIGFLPFALELYVMYRFFRSVLEIERFLGPSQW